MKRAPGSLLLHLYPKAWRETHGPELLELVQDYASVGLRASDRIDLLGAALRVRLSRWLPRAFERKTQLLVVRAASVAVAFIAVVVLSFGVTASLPAGASNSYEALQARSSVVVDSGAALAAAFVVRARGGNRP